MAAVTSTVIFEIEAKSPVGSGTKTALLLREAFLKMIEETNNTALWDDAPGIPDVLMRPSGIWKNLKRGGQEEAFCYCGIPDGSFAVEYGIPFAIPEKQVLTVFLDKFFHVSKWRWCEPDDSRPTYPVNYLTRFEELLWPT